MCLNLNLITKSPSKIKAESKVEQIRKFHGHPIAASERCSRDAIGIRTLSVLPWQLITFIPWSVGVIITGVPIES